MNRRQFLASVGIGAPAALLAAKLGLYERVRSYFFAPKFGWPGISGVRPQQGGSTGVPPPCTMLVTGMKAPEGWDIAPNGLMSRDGQDSWNTYEHDGGLSLVRIQYFKQHQGIEGRLYLRCA